ncbi:MAG: ferric reductase-like transmembrane domain-containing protein [Paenibacillaceae bacterium]
MGSISVWLSTWNVIKAAGFASYLLLFVSVSLGAFSYGNWIPSRTRVVLLAIHQMTGWVGFLFGLLHGLVLTIDKYKPFSLMEVFIPFASKQDSLFNGLGILALYLFLIILVTSDWMKRFGRKAWRSVHYLAFPAYFMSLVHGMAVGYDIHRPWAIAFYSGTATLFFCMIGIRVVLSKRKAKGANPK